jgi:hypothetical protein
MLDLRSGVEMLTMKTGYGMINLLREIEGAFLFFAATGLLYCESAQFPSARNSARTQYSRPFAFLPKEY